MRELIELVETLNVGKLKLKELWAAVIQPGSKMEQLYDLIQSGAVSTDEAAKKKLYASASEAKRFKSLKDKLKERLLDVVFLLDFRSAGITDRQKAHFECNKKLATAVVLLSKDAPLAGIEVLELLLRHTQYFEFTDLTIKILYYLRRHYGTVAGDLKKFDLYRQQYEEYQGIWIKENKAEELYGQLISQYISRGADSEEVAQKAAEYFQEIEGLMTNCSSFRLHLFGRLLQLLIYSSKNDYHTLSVLCQQAILFFKEKPYDPSLSLQAFYYNLAVSQIQLRQFEQGQKVLQQYSYVHEEGSFNWFKWQEIYLLLAMHTGHFDEAYSLCTTIPGHAKFGKQPDHVQESWKIFEAYAHFLARAGKLSQPVTAKFRTGKFLNETPVFSKDKRGRNIPILIARILFFLTDQKRGEFIDCVEALDKYNRRYLKRGETYRSHCFIKMLVQIPAANFHPEAVARKTEKLLHLLESTPLQLANQTYEIEIIPYEELWRIITGILAEQQPRRTRIAKNADVMRAQILK